MDLFNSELKPMLLTEQYKPFDDENYLFEMKFDGIRALIHIDKDKIIIKSRNGNILNKLYPELKEIKKITNKKCIFDGEIVLMDNGKISFTKLQERNRLKSKDKITYYKNNYPVTFVCFDILYENKSLMEYELIKRKKILKNYKDTEYFVKSKYIEKDGIKLFNVVKEQELEGIVAKLKTSKYIPNIRSKEWIKIKNMLVDNFYICGYKEDLYIINLVLGEKINNNYRYVGKVIMSKKNKDYNLIIDCKKNNINLIDFDEKGYNFIEIKYKCRIKYIEKTKNNHLRHASYEGII